MMGLTAKIHNYQKAEGQSSELKASRNARQSREAVDEAARTRSVVDKAQLEELQNGIMKLSELAASMIAKS